MDIKMKEELQLLDFAPNGDIKIDEVLVGLQKRQKTLPSKLFYDAEGSRLFDLITELPEYYPTRTELSIMQTHVDEMVQVMGEQVLLAEFGSGSSLKTRVLLDHMNLVGYVPIDISKEHLMQSAKEIATLYPSLQVLPVCADYTANYYLPSPAQSASHTVVYFPGSTIGNFHPSEAVRFLQQVADVCGQEGGLLIGVDLKKELSILHDAYNDAEGVTAVFNLNILSHLNHDLGTNFVIEQFAHRAFYNVVCGRIEMHLVSLVEQTVQVGEHTVHFAEDETIWTESSYKYTVPEFTDVAKQAGFSLERVWMDEKKLFSVQYYELR